METCNNVNNESVYFDYNKNRKNSFKIGDSLKNIIDVLNFKPENSRLDIGGFSLNIDTIIIIGIAFFLLTDNSCDIVLIICLGLALFNINLNPFR